MRRQEKEITDSSIIREILAKSEICRLGFVDNEEAYIVPVNYAYEDGIIYIHSATGGRKVDLIKRNSRVSFEIEYSNEIIKAGTPCEWSARYRSIMGKGNIIIEEDPVLKKKGLDLIVTRYGSNIELNYDESLFSRTILLILKIESITGKQSGIW